MFPKGRTLYKYIREKTPQFNAQGMLAPTFTNVGNTIAVVNQEEVYPGESFVTPDTVIQDGSFVIDFRLPDPAPATPKNRVLVKYTELLGETDLSQLSC